MAYKIRSRDEHYSNDGLPKRILALDGGGLRGILTLGILARIEQILRERHGGSEDFRLCHYFDLIAGTSTGAIIAATLAIGWPVERIRAKYMELGERVFQKSFLRQGLLRAKYDEGKLIEELQNVYGPQCVLKDDAIRTGLLVVTKRLDTGSAWPISNNPRGKYFAARPAARSATGTIRCGRSCARQRQRLPTSIRSTSSSASRTRASRCRASSSTAASVPSTIRRCSR
jgi:hypothetical protein